MNRNASAVWKGSLHEGEGTLTTESGVLAETQYSYRNSFVDGIGTTNQDKLDDEVEKYRHLEELAGLFLKAKQHHPLAPLPAHS